MQFEIKQIDPVILILGKCFSYLILFTSFYMELRKLETPDVLKVNIKQSNGSVEEHRLVR